MVKEEKIGKYKVATKEATLGNYNPDLVNKVSHYCTNSGIKRTEFITELIERELEGKVLTKGFIELEEPQYINTTELLKNNFSYATTERPSSDLLNQMVLLKVPNNLDTWNKEDRTFCTDVKGIHEGIKPQVALVGSEKENKIKYFYHVFKLEVFYNNMEGRIVKTNHIEVSIIQPEELEIFLNQYPEEVAEKLLEEFLAFEEEIKKDLASDLKPVEIANKYFDPSFIRMLNFNQNVENSVNLIGNLSNTFFNSINKVLPISKEVHEIGEENLTPEEIEKYNKKVAKTNAIQDLFNIKSVLSIRNLKTLHKINKQLEDNPEHPIAKIFNHVITTLEEAIKNPEADSKEALVNVTNYMAKETIKIKEGLDTDFFTSTLEESDVHEDAVKLLSGIAEAESVEDMYSSISKVYGFDVNEVIDVEKKE